MPRSLPQPLLDLAASGQFKVHLRLVVENRNHEHVDLTDPDWLVGCSIQGQSVDRPVSEITLLLFPARGPNNLAPGITQSAYNTYGPLLDAGVRYWLYVAYTAVGGARPAPGSADWHLWFRGEIEDVDWGAVPIRITALEAFGWLQEVEVREAARYGDNDDPVPLPIVLQQILASRLGVAAPALHVESEDADLVGVAEEERGPGKMLDVLRGLAREAGLDVRPQYIDAYEDFRLTLWEPDRDKVVPDFALAHNRYIAVPQLALTRQWVRNEFELLYTTDDGAEHRLTDSVPASIAKYGLGEGREPQFMRLDMRGSGLIRSAASAGRLMDVAKADLAEPYAVQQVTMPLLFWVEVGDLIHFPPNGIHFDVPINLAVVDLSFEVTPRSAHCTVSVRGQPAGAYLGYHKPPREANTTPAIWDVRVEYPDTATARVTIGGRNAYAAEIHVHYAIAGQETFPDPAAPPPADYVLVGANTLDLPRPLEDAETIGWLQLEARGQYGTPRGGAIRRRIEPHRAPFEPPAPGDPGAPGDVWETRYYCATIEPGAPAGDDPPGWHTAPQPCGTTIWASTARRSGETGLIVGAWSQPVRWNGLPGGDGLPGPPGESDALLPQIDSLDDFPGSAADRRHLYGRVTAPDGETGTLEVKTNPGSYASPSAGAAAEGSVGIGAFPFLWTPDTVFNLAGGGTGKLCENVMVHPGQPKVVYYRITLTDGRTTGWREYRVKGSNLSNVDASGGIVALRLAQLLYQPEMRVNDPEMRDPTAWAPEGPSWFHVQAPWIPGSGYAWGRSANAQATAVRNSARFPVAPGWQFAVSCHRLAGLGGNGVVYPRLSYYDADGVEIANSGPPVDLPPVVGDAWQEVASFVVVPAGAATASADVVSVGHTVGQWFVRRIAAQRITTSDLMAAGAVLTRHLSTEYFEAETGRVNTLIAAVVQALVMQVGWYIESSNYVPGQSGFRITGDGDADINSATIRGTLNGVSGTFSGTVTADAEVQAGLLSAPLITVGLGSEARISARPAVPPGFPEPNRRLTIAAGRAFGGGVMIEDDPAGRVGFYGTTPLAKLQVVGSRGGNSALASLLTALSSLGLITDGTTP